MRADILGTYQQHPETMGLELAGMRRRRLGSDGGAGWQQTAGEHHRQQQQAPVARHGAVKCRTPQHAPPWAPSRVPCGHPVGPVLVSMNPCDFRR